MTAPLKFHNSSDERRTVLSGTGFVAVVIVVVIGNESMGKYIARQSRFIRIRKYI